MNARGWPIRLPAKDKPRVIIVDHLNEYIIVEIPSDPFKEGALPFLSAGRGKKGFAASGCAIR